MIDVKQPLRTAYYQLLNGNLIYLTAAIPVGDDLVKLQSTGAQLYVFFSTQSGNDTSTFSSFDSKQTIVIDIVYRGKTRAPKSIVDNIAGQILNLVRPTPSTNGLPAQAGIAINNVQNIQDQTLDLQIDSSTTIRRRLLTFSQDVRQTT